MTNNIILAALYIRCSTDMQAETSPEQQRQLAEKYALENNYKIIVSFEDIGKSGISFEKRPGFNSLLKAVQSNPPFQAVLVLDESRWGRAGASSSIYYKELFKRTGNVDVVMVRTIAKTGNATFDTMLNAFEGGLSHEESRTKSIRTLDGCRSAVRNGHSAGGTSPFGYKRVAVNRFTGERRDLRIVKDRDGNPVVNEKGLLMFEQIRPKEEYTVWEIGLAEEVAVVKQIFEWKGREGYGISKIAKMLNAKGLPCPKRGKWNQSDQKWSAGAVRYIVINPVYMGVRTYDRLKKNGIGKSANRFIEKDKSKWLLVDGGAPAIVSVDLWNAANPASIARENGAKSKRRFDSPYPLSGLISCSHCGFNFHGRAQQIGQPGKRTKRRIYADSGYTGKGDSVCASFSVDAEQLERIVVVGIKRYILNAGGSEEILRILEAQTSDTASDQSEQPKSFETEIAGVDRKIQHLLGLAESGVDIEEVKKRLLSLKNEKDRLAGQRNRVAAFQASRKMRDDWAGRIAKFFSDFDRRFQEADPSERKMLMSKILKKIIIDREQNVAQCFMRKLPKGEVIKVDELLEKEQTHLNVVSPTRFELVLEA